MPQHAPIKAAQEAPYFCACLRSSAGSAALFSCSVVTAPSGSCSPAIIASQSHAFVSIAGWCERPVLASAHLRSSACSAAVSSCSMVTALIFCTVSMAIWATVLTVSTATSIMVVSACAGSVLAATCMGTSIAMTSLKGQQ